MITQTIINEVKNRLVSTYQPLEIYLFGSYAWGNPTDESDLDLLVVVEKSDEKSHRRPLKGYILIWNENLDFCLAPFAPMERSTG